MKKWIKKAASVALVTTLLAGCSFGGKEESSNTPQALKVMYHDENSFYQEYGMLFSTIYPEIEISVVTMQSLYRGNNTSEDGEEFDFEKAKKELIEKEKPDILMLDMLQYEEFALEGKFTDLDAYIVRDKFDTENLVPGMIDYMKELGGGQLYGLPSGFSSQVLFYNKSLFDKYNISYPTDKMTWDEVLQLAKQFPIDGEKEDRIYGLKAGYSGGLSELANSIAGSEGLSYVNPATKTMTINTAGWKNAIQTAYDAIKSEALYFEAQNNNMMSFSSGYNDYLLRNPFTTNRVAMTLDGSYYIREMKEAAESYSKEEGKVIKDWDMVTIPVSAQNPDVSRSTWYNNIFSISKDSPNADAAWKFISYISSEEHARVKSKLTYNNGFSIHTKYIKDDEGHNYEAFYKLKPVKPSMDYKEYEKLPKQFNMMFYNFMEEELKEIQDGKKSVDEVLSILQTKGEELLAQESMTDEEIQKMWQERYEKQMQEEAGNIDTVVVE
ncbi:ABC transporter substrate-binding protein [Paenibacillus paeoniae]|uniref:Extracellular solute-binding protein n=1 Tax=Paenibacillus paeoniae TaxID=2292705 RepID=A0A371P686_9BACL|nr:extracellular solute-binding protein [Paenibacillus paeoniae]REK71429.1 extracellular solute-binding protein [Paenibacillus paeoniae]